MPLRKIHHQNAAKWNGFMTSLPSGRWPRRNGTSRVPYKSIASPERDKPRSLRMMASIDVRRARRLYRRSRYWRCRIFRLTRVYRASNPPLCVVVVVGGLRGCNITVTPMLQPPQSRPTNDGFAGTGHTLLRRHRAAFPTNTSLRRNRLSRVRQGKLSK